MEMKTKARFLHYQNTQVTDEFNQLLYDDVILKDGTILRFNDQGYLDGLIECIDGHVEFWKNGKLHGNPAVIGPALSYQEIWEDGVFKENLKK